MYKRQERRSARHALGVVGALVLTVFLPLLAAIVARDGRGVGALVGRARGGARAVRSPFAALGDGAWLSAGEFVSTCAARPSAAPARGLAPGSGRLPPPAEPRFLWLQEDGNIVLGRGCSPASLSTVLWCSNSKLDDDDRAAAPVPGGALVMHLERGTLRLAHPATGRVLWRRRRAALPRALRAWPLVRA